MVSIRLIILLLLLHSTAQAFKSKDAECLGQLFPLRLPALQDYKWGGDDSSLIGIREDGNHEIVSKDGTYIIDKTGCKLSNPDRSFDAVVAIAVTNAKIINRRNNPELVARISEVCKNAESEKIRNAVNPRPAGSSDGNSRQ